MIFDADAVCRLEFCREYSGEGEVNPPEAALTVLLINAGSYTVPGRGAPVPAARGDVLLCCGGVQAVPLQTGQVTAVGINGLAAQQVQSHGVLRADAHTAAAAAPLIHELSAAPAARTGALCYALLCALADADDAAPALPALIAEAVAAIHENYAGLYGVEELSEQLGVSKSHLVRLFRCQMGVTPGRYLTQVRLSAAKALLAETSHPLEVVATLCGFAGANYFCRVFKKETGQTPAAFRAAAEHTQSTRKLRELEEMLYM